MGEPAPTPEPAPTQLPTQSPPATSCAHEDQAFASLRSPGKMRYTPCEQELWSGLPGLRFCPEGLVAFGTGCSKFALRLPSRGPAQDACSIFACVERCCGVSGSQDAWARTVLRLGLLGASRCTDVLPTQGAHSCAGGLFKGPAY